MTMPDPIYDPDRYGKPETEEEFRRRTAYDPSAQKARRAAGVVFAVVLVAIVLGLFGLSVL